MKRIAILGVSGSIGLQALEVIEANPSEFMLYGATVHRQVETLEAIHKKHALKAVCLPKEHHQSFIEEEISLFDDLVKFVASLPEDVTLLNALVGSVGLASTIQAIEMGLDVLLANKESLVVGGEIIAEKLTQSSSKLIPIDSEHSALSQCLRGRSIDDVEKVVITASGGSFRDYSREQLATVTREDALKHPNWSMGEKITIDSATMMNKVFEVIEAHYLFGLPYEKIEAVCHRESVVHAIVYFKDGNIVAHIGPSDMRIPILSAMQGEKCLPYRSIFDITKAQPLHFEPIDSTRFPLFDLGVAVAKRKGLHTVTMNAANEIAVELFLAEKIRYLDIEHSIETCLDYFDHTNDLTLEKILAHDQAVRSYVKKLYLDGETHDSH